MSLLPSSSSPSPFFFSVNDGHGQQRLVVLPHFVAALSTAASTASASASSSSSSTTERTRTTTDLRTRLLQAALDQVRQHGWTMQAIFAALRQEVPEASLSYATTLTPKDLVQFFMEDCNRRLRETLREQYSSKKDNTTPNDAATTPTRLDRIHAALQIRLQYVADYIAMGRWHQGMALGLSDPEAALATSEQLKDLIATVVRETDAGANHDDDDEPPLSDTAQLALGAVYVAAECHMLQDKSPEYAQTWEFLRHNLQHWQALLLRAPDGLSSLPIPLPSSSSMNDAAFLANTLATAFGNGIWSVSGGKAAIPMPPTPDQVWKAATEGVGSFGSSLSTMAPPPAKDKEDASTTTTRE